MRKNHAIMKETQASPKLSSVQQVMDDIKCNVNTTIYILHSEKKQLRSNILQKYRLFITTRHYLVNLFCVLPKF